MIGVDTMAVLRREFYVLSKTIKEFVRDLHVSRNTVRFIFRCRATVVAVIKLDRLCKLNWHGGIAVAIGI